MKKITLITLLFLVSGFISASDSFQKHKHGKENKEFDNVLKSYEKLHQSFFDNDNNKIKENAKVIITAIEKIKDDEIVKTLKYTKEKLHLVSKTDSLDENKKAFNIISQGLLVVLEKHAPNKNYLRYYCPMVQKYWIQNISKSEKTYNPYKSKSMPHCGGPKKEKS